MANDKILEVENLSVSFNTYAGEVKAVRGVSFNLAPGETLAFVGESGCGKSVTAKSLLRLLKPPFAVIKEGSKITCDGKDVLALNKKELCAFRGDEISMIFQDPMTSLNPTMTVGKQIMESLRIHRHMNKKEAREEAIKMLKIVNIPSPEKRIDSYPHEMSGGMRQRVMIAMALACNPKVLIADEPTTALDVTIQAQIMDLMRELKEKMNTAIILVTHDLGVVANFADKIQVMYAGQIVERGTAREIFYDSKHPYTWALLSSLPQLMDRGMKLYSIAGTPPSLYNEIVGDAFAPRNPYCLRVDTLREPPMFKVSDTHYAKTWLLDPRAPKVEKPEIIHDIHGTLMKVFNI